MKIKILMFFSVFTLLISTICVSVGAYSVVEDATINEQSQTVWGYNMFDRQRFSSSQNINEYLYLDNLTYTNCIAFEGGYPFFTAIDSFMNNDVSILFENTYATISPYVYDFTEGNYVQNLLHHYYYYSYLNLDNDNRAVYFDYASFNTSNASLVDINGLWSYDRYFYWDTLLLDTSNRLNEPFYMILDMRADSVEVPNINFTYNFDIYDYDLHVFENRIYNVSISYYDYIELFEVIPDTTVPLFHYPIFEPLYEYAELPTFITNLEIIIDASEYSTNYTAFSCFTFSLTNEINVNLWSDLIAYTPTSVITNDIDFVNWLVRGVSGVFDTELIPGISMGNILKLVLSIALVVAVLKYFVGG